MTQTLVLLIIAFSLLLGLVTFVQLLYLESLRLRTRDFPAIKFFKETLEDKIGFQTEDGAGSFTLVKHTAILLIGVLYFLVFADGQAWTWPEVLETAAHGARKKVRQAGELQSPPEVLIEILLNAGAVKVHTELHIMLIDLPGEIVD